MGRRTKRLAPLVLLLLVALLGGLLRGEALQRNLARVFLNQAVAAPALDRIARQGRLAQAVSLEPDLAPLAAAEEADRTAARAFLAARPALAHLEPGRQLLDNPDFASGSAGWIGYNSNWTLDPDRSTEAGNVLTFSRSGTGHGTLSQPLDLRAGRCYLFSTTGALERLDETPTFWLYWETYPAGRPVGNHAITGRGDQPWERRLGLFCLEPDGPAVQRVVVAPVSVYGDARVALGSARLYELQEIAP